MYGHSSGAGTSMRAAGDSRRTGRVEVNALFALSPAYEVAMSLAPSGGGGWEAYRGFYETPTFVLSGDKDNTTDLPSQLDWFETARSPHVLAIGRGFSHCFVDARDFIVSECNFAVTGIRYGVPTPGYVQPGVQVAEAHYLAAAWFTLQLYPDSLRAQDPRLASLIWGGGARRDGTLAAVLTQPELVLDFVSAAAQKPEAGTPPLLAISSVGLGAADADEGPVVARLLVNVTK